MRYLMICLMLFVFQSPTELSAKDLSWQAELITKIKQANFPEWMVAQINEDLEPFREKGITLQDIEAIPKTYHTSPGSQAFVICQIKNGQFLHLPQTIPDSNSRARMFVEGMQALSTAILLPNVTFIVYMGESFIEEGNKAPVFTWCKHREKGKGAVNFPDYEALNGNYNALHGVAVGNLLPWELKQNKAFWRGTLTGGYGDSSSDPMRLPRIKLVLRSKQFPELIDAKIVGPIGPDEIRETLLPCWASDSSGIPEHLQYKYQILADGHVAAFSRAYWQLFSNCLILKQDSLWYQWFYRALKPYEHYIPYKKDASDLAEQIVWAIKNDAVVYQISKNANHFAENNLRHSDVMLYVYLLLNEYAKLQKYSEQSIEDFFIYSW
jgi:hypothetical protein